MIPRKIHYVWLGGAKYTPSVKRCIKSWQDVMPDYEIKCWNEENFDIDSVPWVKEAIASKKWSLASDYIRHYALYTEGGIYMDTDVMVYKPFDKFLQYNFFTSIEFHPKIFSQHGKYDIDEEGLPIQEGNEVAGLGLLAALFGAERGNLYIKECLDFFGNRHFMTEDGYMFMDLINPAIMPMLALKYGYRYIDKNQLLKDNMMIFSSSVFAGNLATKTKDSYAIHYCDSSWRDLPVKSKIKNWLFTHFPTIFRE